MQGRKPDKDIEKDEGDMGVSTRKWKEQRERTKNIIKD